MVRRPEHDDIDQYEDSPPSANTAASDAFNIVVNVPDKIKIRMVNAEALSEYEIWFFLASVLSSAVVGFAVAYFQAIDAKSASAPAWGWSCVIFIFLFVVAISVSFRKRMLLQQQGRDISLKTAGARVNPRGPE
jgi:hypothetical protein